MTFALPAPKDLVTKPQRFAPLLLALLLTASTGCSDDNRTSPPSSSQQPTTAPSAGRAIQALDETPPVPDVTLETMSGETIALADRPGEVLLINFWATWCAPCRKEIPDLIALQDELGPQGFTVIGVSLDREGAEVVEPFLDEYDINYPIVLDPEASLDEAFGGVYGLPMTFVVDPQGQMQYRVLGTFPPDEMRSKLVALLDEASPDEPS